MMPSGGRRAATLEPAWLLSRAAGCPSPLFFPLPLALVGWLSSTMASARMAWRLLGRLAVDGPTMARIGPAVKPLSLGQLSPYSGFPKNTG